jgi:outer membrane protein assembly factor BamB
LVGCAADPVDTDTHELARIRSIAGELPVVGVDSDHEGGLWLAYRLRLERDYKANADVRVVHLAADGSKLAEFRYVDDYEPISGLAFSGSVLYLNYNEVGISDHNRIRALDANTGEHLGWIPTETGIVDVEYRKGALLMSNLWRTLIALDPATGHELWRVPLEFLDQKSSEARGIAAVGGRTWVASLTDAHVYLVDDAGALLGGARLPYGEDDWNADVGLQMAWDGSALIVQRRNQITWFAVHEK